MDGATRNWAEYNYPQKAIDRMGLFRGGTQRYQTGGEFGYTEAKASSYPAGFEVVSSGGEKI